MTRRLLLATTLLALAACGGGADPSPPPPDEALFLSGLAHWDAALGLTASARLLADPAARAAQELAAVAEYGLAQADFRALPVRHPTSVRLDNAAYLDGRCDYEIGTLDGDRSRFESARDHLDAAATAHAGSKHLEAMLYFSGRAAFRLAELDAAAPTPATDAVAAAYAAARARFAAAVTAAAADPSPIFGDNAAYYVGRCDYEIGYVHYNPLEAAAAVPTSGSAGWIASDAAFTLAEAELAAIPATSSYLDNARYYLGRARLERPADLAATRVANLQAAIAAFDEVLAVPGTSYRDGALYWRGRSRYALAFRQGAGGVPLAAGLDTAIADFKQVEGAGPAPSAAPSGYADNALAYVARAYLNLAPPVCTTDRAGDAAPGSACAARATLVARFPASFWIPSTESYLTAASCACP